MEARETEPGYRICLWSLAPNEGYALNFCTDVLDERGRVLAVYHMEPGEDIKHPEGGLIPPLLVLSRSELLELKEAIDDVLRL